jgi:signal transduction histidine kinase
MSDMKLSDQLGAMAIIDSLYAQQIALEEHLNLPELRHRVAARIREYYRQNGQDVSDELIEQGVTSWFASRLRYQAPKPGLAQRLGAFLYMTSRSWLKWLGLLLLAVALVFAYGVYTENRDLAQLNREIIARQTEHKQIESQAGTLAAQIDSYTRVPLNYASRPVADIITQARQKLSEIKTQAGSAVPASLVGSKEQLQQRLEEHIHSNYQLFTLYDQALTLAKKLPQLIKEDRRLSSVTRDPSFNTFTHQAPELTSLVSSAALALAANKESAPAEIDKVVSVADREGARLELFNELEQRSGKLAALRLSPGDKKVVDEQIAAAKNLVATADLSNSATPAGWADTLQGLDDTYRFITTPLRLVIVDRVGEKSGVERTYDNSGGKSWYLIAEAITPQEQPFPLPIKDSETGRQEKVRTFGIRISQAEYEKLKRDKLDDGHIDNELVGVKPANQLTIKYVRPVQQGRIISW